MAISSTLSEADLRNLLIKDQEEMLNYMLNFVEKDHLIENLNRLLEIDKKKTLVLLDNLFTKENPKAKIRIAEWDNWKNDNEFVLQAKDLLEKAISEKYGVEFNPIINSIKSSLAWITAHSHSFNDLEYAYNEFEKISKEEPDNAYVLFGKSYCKIWLKDYETANDILINYEKLIEKHSSQLETNAWYDRGFCCFKLDKLDEAKKYFKKFVDAGSQNIGSRSFYLDGVNFLAYIAAETGDLDFADANFDRVLLDQQWNSGATIGKRFVKQQRNIYAEKKELIASTQNYLKTLFTEIPSGMRTVGRMYSVQFAVGVFFIILAIILAALGKDIVISGISGVAGSAISVASLVNKAPIDLQRNRVNSAQWTIAYYNWINALYMVSSATDKLAKNSKESKWEEMKVLQDYMSNMTNQTIKLMKEYCVISENSMPQ